MATETSDNGVGSGQGKILATVCVGHIWKPDHNGIRTPQGEAEPEHMVRCLLLLPFPTFSVVLSWSCNFAGDTLPDWRLVVSYKSAPTLAIDYWSLDAIFPGVLGESVFFFNDQF